MYIMPLRMARNAVAAIEMVTDYLVTLYGIPEGSAKMEDARHQVHVRNAERLKNLCFKNGGIYIKLGQHIGQLDYLVPREFVQTMRASTLNRCPIQTFAQVRDVFLAELGLYPSEVFAEFSEVPMASASLAQVHEARTYDGRKVAVKVQHTHLTDTSDADIHTVNFIVHVGHWLFPAFDYRWLVAEMRESLPNELDFMKEGKNSERCVENFARMSPHIAPYIAVPQVFWEISTPRLMCMEFMEGIGVTDVKAMKELGIKPKEVAHLISETFAEMIFHHGFVHCDPHAANMMLRVKPGTKSEPQLILLDHGLYKTLGPTLRGNYAALWKSLVFADPDGIKEYSLRMGAGEDLYTLFASILTMRPWRKVVAKSHDHLQFSIEREDVGEIQDYAATSLLKITELLRRLPRVILLLLKTNDCLRAVDNALGTPTNTFVIVGRASSTAVSELQRTGLFAPILKTWDKLELETRLWVWQTAAAAFNTQIEFLKLGKFVVPVVILAYLRRMNLD